MTLPDAGAAVLLLLCAPQSDELGRFEQLPEVRRALVVRTLERRVMLDPDELIQSIVSMARGYDSYGDAPAETYHDPGEWAPGVAPERTLVRAGTSAHDAVTPRLPELRDLPDLRRAVSYDWGTGEVVRGAARPSDADVFHNLLNGYPPGSDEAVARVLALLDRDPERRRLAAYLDHLYADLDARVYEGVTLYRAWYSGEVVDVPDVDAIPFAVRILKDRSFRSPIPPGPRRTALYREIRDATFAFRKYRTLREAAAAAFVRAEPDIDPTYARLVPRFHYLYAAEGNDPRRVAEILRSIPDREALLARTDEAVRSSPEAFELREGRKSALAEMAAELRALALDALARQGSDG